MPRKRGIFQFISYVIGSDSMTLVLAAMYVGEASDISSAPPYVYIYPYNCIRLADILRFACLSRITCLRLIRHSARYSRNDRLSDQFAASPFLVS